VWAGYESFRREPGVSEIAKETYPAEPKRQSHIQLSPTQAPGSGAEITDQLSGAAVKRPRVAEANFCHLGQVVTEDRHGRVVDTRLTLAIGWPEREAAADIAAITSHRCADDSPRGFCGDRPHLGPNAPPDNAHRLQVQPLFTTCRSLH
jgi:hypothetical protein